MKTLSTRPHALPQSLAHRIVSIGLGFLLTVLRKRGGKQRNQGWGSLLKSKVHMKEGGGSGGAVARSEKEVKGGGRKKMAGKRKRSGVREERGAQRHS
eukprot:754700-Hanusia_phi.AAC.3